MNVKIPTRLHDELCKLPYKEYLFGSQLHGIATSESDYDYIRVIGDVFSWFTTKAKYLPNIHSWQHDLDDSTQIVWMTEAQFYRNLFSGDGNMIADVVLLSGDFDNPLFLCRTYKIIKGYLGVAKRDLKIHGDNPKKRFHAYRSLFMATKLMDNSLPTIKDIQGLRAMELPDKDWLWDREQQLRTELNAMLDAGKIDLYPKFKETDELLQSMVDNNNIKDFKY